MEGFLNIDKPAGITSHDVVARMRRIVQMKRVGHAGTLDPLATGVLLVGVGRATRLIEYLVGQPKRYVTDVRLGQATNTYDADGEVVSEGDVGEITADSIQTALAQFRGDILQIPPMYSAIKRDGQPLYKLARKGETVEIDPRPVTIYGLDILAWESPILTLDIRCSTGTYIRSIAHDLGQALGCGGHVQTLRRTAIGDFRVDSSVSLGELTQENVGDCVMPTITAVSHLHRLDLSLKEARRFYFGQRIPADMPDETLAQAFDPDGKFVGVLVAQNGEWRGRKVMYEIEKDEG